MRMKENKGKRIKETMTQNREENLKKKNRKITQKLKWTNNKKNRK